MAGWSYEESENLERLAKRANPRVYVHQIKRNGRIITSQKRAWAHTTIEHSMQREVAVWPPDSRTEVHRQEWQWMRWPKIGGDGEQIIRLERTVKHKIMKVFVCKFPVTNTAGNVNATAFTRIGYEGRARRSGIVSPDYHWGSTNSRGCKLDNSRDDEEETQIPELLKRHKQKNLM